MVLSDLCRPGDDRGLLRFLLSVLRDFDLIHKKRLCKNSYGKVDFEEQRIYISKKEGYENDDA